MNTTPARTKVLIVDDHPAAREGLALRIARQVDLEVCGEAADVEGALALLETTRPDLMVIDICLGGDNGIELIKRVKNTASDVRMLAWSMHDESLYAARSLRAGAMGYINKGQATTTIVEAIRCVLDDRVYLNQPLAEKRLDSQTSQEAQQTQSQLASLSDRELEVFRYIGLGFSTTQVAKQLGVSPKTVETYRSRIKEKLNLANGTELSLLAIQSAILGD